MARTRSTKNQTRENQGMGYQFLITLLHVDPPIWRRIVVPDFTLDQLHEAIQGAMGWTNSHLHHFKIRGEWYGDPDLLGGDLEFNGIDSTELTLSDLLARSRKGFKFLYEYDFGDGWQHQIVFEGKVPLDPNGEYPVCLEGERACPPEDCGGAWGYADIIEILEDKKHPDYRETRAWVGPRFKAEKFSAAEASKMMRGGAISFREFL